MDATLSVQIRNLPQKQEVAIGLCVLSKLNKIVSQGAKKILAYRADEDGTLHYIENSESSERRFYAHTLSHEDLQSAVPAIQFLAKIHFLGVCHGYVFSQLLGTKKIDFMKIKDGSDLLSSYFVQITNPKKDDVVVYYNDQGSCIHWGLYKGGGIIESKWGWQAIYRHTFFDVPDVYGNTICCYTIKDDASFTELRKALVLS